MREHNLPIFRKMQIRLQSMRTNSQRSLEAAHGVLGEAGFVASVGNGLGEVAVWVAAGLEGCCPWCCLGVSRIRKRELGGLPLGIGFIVSSSSGVASSFMLWSMLSYRRAQKLGVSRLFVSDVTDPNWKCLQYQSFPLCLSRPCIFRGPALMREAP